MKPSQTSTYLRRIASKIDNCHAPVRREMVIRDIRHILAALTEDGDAILKRAKDAARKASRRFADFTIERPKLVNEFELSTDFGVAVSVLVNAGKELREEDKELETPIGPATNYFENTSLIENLEFSISLSFMEGEGLIFHILSDDGETYEIVNQFFLSDEVNQAFTAEEENFSSAMQEVMDELKALFSEIEQSIEKEAIRRHNEQLQSPQSLEKEKQTHMKNLKEMLSQPHFSDEMKQSIQRWIDNLESE